MGLCGSSCHKYDSIVIRKNKVTRFADGRVVKETEVMHKRDIEDIALHGELAVEDLD